MNEFIPHHFEKLKTELLQMSGIKQIIPSDCKRLSVEIYSKTHKQVSETTLKRVFGFAYTPFKPSVFTVSALAEYCGYTGWNNFTEKCDDGNKHLQQQDVSWRSIADHAKRITSFTLQALKNRSGIPFKQTIPRKFIDDQLAIFEEEVYTGIIISAPAGYGKTIALCHWVDKRINYALYNEGDIVLFFNCNLLTNTTPGQGLNEWLMALLGITTDNDAIDIDLFAKGPQKGKFYLVIDGLNDCDFKRNEFYHLFGQLIDLVSLYQKHSWFKVVLSMRSSTWLNNRHFLANKMNDWFLGFMADWQQSINVPFFDGDEIAQLNDLIDPFSPTPVIKDLHVYNLSHPLYFQYYYQLHQANFSINKVNPASIYELTTEHITQKVYKGRFNDDKMILLRALVSNMDFEKGNYRIDKLRVNALLKNHQQAYQELLSSGFLHDTNNSQGIKYDTCLEFNNNNLLEYAIAEKLLADNNGKFDEILTERIHTQLYLGPHKLPVIKWCVYKMVTGNYHIDLQWLINARLTIAQRAELILLLGQLFKKQHVSAQSPSSISGIFRNDPCGILFNYFVGAEFIDSDYEQALRSLLGFDLTDHQALLVKTYLSLIAVIKLDITMLEAYLAEMKNMAQQAFQCMPVNPLNCLDAIYFYLKFGMVKTEALTEITRFSFHASVPKNCSGEQTINDVVPILAVFTLMLCRNPDKNRRFINALEKIYPDHSGTRHFLLKTWVTNGYATANDKRAPAMFDELDQQFRADGAGYTTFMKLSYYALKVKIAQLKGNHVELLTELKQLVALCDSEDYKMLKVSTIAHLLSNFAHMKDHIGLFDRFYFDFVKTTRNSGCRTESFIVQVDPPLR